MVSEDIVKDGVDADVTVVEPGRKTACTTFLRLVSLFVVSLQSLTEKFLPAATTLNVATLLSDNWSDFVVDAKR
jgi:hypothetical protein